MQRHIVRGLLGLFAMVMFTGAWGLPGNTTTAGEAAFQVTKTADTNDGSCDADCSLREAIIAANAAGDATVNVPAGTYTLTIAGIDEDDGATGDLDITGDVTISGAGAGSLITSGGDATIIDGNQLEGVLHVFPDASLNLADLTIRNGNNGSGAGGVFSEGLLTLSRVHVIENASFRVDPFGGVGGVGSDGPEVLITDSVISNNTVSGAEGSGGAWFSSDTEVTITNTVISMNETQSGASTAGILINGVGRLDRVTISDNHGPDDVVGGLFAYGPVIVRRSLIEGNTGGDGSVAGVRTDTSLTMSDTTVSDNDAGAHSTGGIYMNSGTASLNRVTLSENSATTDATGAMYVGGNASLNNVTVSGNQVIDDATAGLHNAGNVSINFSTFEGNAAPGAGDATSAISNAGSMAIANTIVGPNNTGGTEVCAGTALTSGGHNIDAGNTCGFLMASDHSNTNPLLGPLADNAGFVPTHALMQGSPAIGGGGICPPPDTDARFFPRPLGLGCDIGAYEANGPALTGRIGGDLNCNGVLEGDDALPPLIDAAGLTSGPVAQGGVCPTTGDEVLVAGYGVFAWGDVTCDGMIDAFDALLILKGAAGLPPSLIGDCPWIGDQVQVGPAP